MTRKQLVTEYQNDIKEIYDLTIKLANLDLTDKEDIDYLYTSAIVNICIKFESFTVNIYSKIFDEKNISFNVPWAYVKYVSEKLKLKNAHLIEEAKECWEFYNTLKHVNSVSARRQEKIMQENNIETLIEVLNLVYKSIVNLLQSFE